MASPLKVTREPLFPRWTRDPEEREWQGDARALARDLEAAVAGGVRFDAGYRGIYALDASNYRQPPIGVVLPRDPADVERAIEVCRRYQAPILGRGGGTSLAGQCCNHAVVFDFSRYMNHVVELDVAGRRARVQPGCVLDTLRDQAKEHELTFGPDPATHDHCCLGGMIGNDSCGPHSVMTGRTAENVRELEILTYDGLRTRVGETSEEELRAIVAQGGRRGEIYRALRDLRDRYAPLIRERFPDIPRRVSGYNLDELLPEKGFHVARALVGTEGTCAIFLEATVDLVRWPPYRALVVIGYDDAYTAADHVPQILEYAPIALEGMDHRLIDDMHFKKMHEEDIRQLPEGQGWLIVEFGGDSKQEAVAAAEEVAARVRGERHVIEAHVYRDQDKQERIWEVRESGLGATARVPMQGETWPGWEDSAVPPENMGRYLRELRTLLDRHGLTGAFYGHFGDGCLHTRIDFDLRTREGIADYLSFVREAAELCVEHGGSLSGEHGDGQARAELLPIMFGEELCQAFREFKAIWDPENRMNPGKIVDPYPIASNLRLGTGYHPWEPETKFRYPEDDGSFPTAARRCVGVGKCRREGGGTMCPSYMVTRDELHSTRGRAHLLHEMLTGFVVEDGFDSQAVEEALDLCLACKGCKHDCPVNVDMATYKAEFYYHHYKRKKRPIHAYAMGLIYWWARLASHVPRLANFFTRTPGLRQIVQSLGGLTPKRRMPPFATWTFRDWFREHRPGRLVGKSVGAQDDPGRGAVAEKRVILWPDTFNNFFHPETAVAAVEVLERAGFEVVMPARMMCCGRPLYDYGFLDQAEALLAEILGELAAEIESGVPVVGLEPSCTATFKDELTNLFPNDENAKRLRGQTYTLAGFLQAKAPAFEPPRLVRKALFHGHCHQKAILGQEADKELLDKMGIEVEAPATGCCGLAGSFGFEAGHHEVSMACGERVLLPAVRGMAETDLIVTDGFSCRTQIEEGTKRKALHLAQVLQMAYREGTSGPPGKIPERDYVPRDRGRLRPGWVALATGVLGVGAGFVVVRWLSGEERFLNEHQGRASMNRPDRPIGDH